MSVLLTGSTGFVGPYIQKEMSCIPCVDAKVLPIDLCDEAALSAFVQKNTFDQVIHLGGIAFVPDSFKNPKQTFDINFMGTFYLMSALQKKGFQGRVLYVGSADVYGLLSESDLPVSEKQIPKPRSPYAVSKIAAEALCYQMSQTEDFEVLLARPFNHIGPNQSEKFVISEFAKQIIEIKKGLRDSVIEVGDIEVTRDFTDVRDVIKAYASLLEKGKNGEIYNICSGQEYQIKNLLLLMLEIASVKAEIKVDPKKLRKSEQRRVVGSFEKIKQATGWCPSRPIEESLKNILDDWEVKIS